MRKLGAEPVTVMARVAAVGLWTLCGDWSSDSLTDGFVPWPEVEKWDPERSLAKRLIDVDLCHEDEIDGESGIQFHDWPDWNPTKAEVMRKRAEQAERVRRWREKHGYAKSGNALQDALPDVLPGAVETGNALQDASPGIPPNPNPTRREGSGEVSSLGAETLPRKTSRGAPRGTRLPDDFAVTATMVEWARANAPHVDGRIETAQFCDYWHSKAGLDATKVDWLRTWYRWMRKAEQQAGRPSKSSAPTDADWEALK